jgi:hypothetical protein
MWKAPYRPNNKVTQPFNDGFVQIFTVENVAEPGDMPKESLVLKETLRFESQRLGINRLYMSKQNQAEIEAVLRVPNRNTVSNQDIAIMNGDETKQYAVESIQTVMDVWPPSMDIALKRIEQKYEIPKEG